MCQNGIFYERTDENALIVSYLRVYCISMPKILRFEISDEGWFSVVGVPNAKYLAFDTPDGNALIAFKRRKNAIITEVFINW